MSDNLLQKAARIKLLVLDVDGVLTNGSVYTDGRGTEFKGFNIKDGHGLKLAQRAGLGLVWLSGRPSAATTGRADELGINEVHQGVHFKLPKFREILAQHGLSPAQAAFMGDDLIDIPPHAGGGPGLGPGGRGFRGAPGRGLGGHSARGPRRGAAGPGAHHAGQRDLATGNGALF